MKNSFSFLILAAISLLLILVVISYYLFSNIAASTKSPDGEKNAGGDSLRQHGITDLASKISYLTANDEISWPSAWQLIGTSATNCQVNNLHCQITTAECFDLQKISNDKFKLPVDPAHGSSEKTGYAIKLEGTKLHIKACYTENDTAISQEVRL